MKNIEGSSAYNTENQDFYIQMTNFYNNMLHNVGRLASIEFITWPNSLSNDFNDLKKKIFAIKPRAKYGLVDNVKDNYLSNEIVGCFEKTYNFLEKYQQLLERINNNLDDDSFKQTSYDKLIHVYNSILIDTKNFMESIDFKKSKKIFSKYKKKQGKNEPNVNDAEQIIQSLINLNDVFIKEFSLSMNNLGIATDQEKNISGSSSIDINNENYQEYGENYVHQPENYNGHNNGYSNELHNNKNKDIDVNIEDDNEHKAGQEDVIVGQNNFKYNMHEKGYNGKNNNEDYQVKNENYNYQYGNYDNLNNDVPLGAHNLVFEDYKKDFIEKNTNENNYAKIYGDRINNKSNNKKKSNEDSYVDLIKKKNKSNNKMFRKYNNDHVFTVDHKNMFPVLDSEYLAQIADNLIQKAQKKMKNNENDRHMFNSVSKLIDEQNHYKFELTNNINKIRRSIILALRNAGLQAKAIRGNEETLVDFDGICENVKNSYEQFYNDHCKITGAHRFETKEKNNVALKPVAKDIRYMHQLFQEDFDIEDNRKPVNTSIQSQKETFDFSRYFLEQYDDLDEDFKLLLDKRTKKFDEKENKQRKRKQIKNKYNNGPIMSSINETNEDLYNSKDIEKNNSSSQYKRLKNEKNIY